MHLSTASALIFSLTALSLAAPASETLAARELTAPGTVTDGFQVPKGIASGVYSVTIDKQGVSHHTKIGEVDGAVQLVARPSTDVGTTVSLETRDILRRGLDGVQCANYAEPQGDREAAVQALANQCSDGRWIGPGTHWYSISGNTVAFWCNASPIDVWCSWADVHWVSYNLLPANCGAATAGWGIWSNPSYSIGHHLTDGSRNFCGVPH